MYFLLWHLYLFVCLFSSRSPSCFFLVTCAWLPNYQDIKMYLLLSGVAAHSVHQQPSPVWRIMCNVLRQRCVLSQILCLINTADWCWLEKFRLVSESFKSHCPEIIRSELCATEWHETITSSGDRSPHANKGTNNGLKVLFVWIVLFVISDPCGR